MIDDTILLGKTPGGRPVFIGGLCQGMLNLKFIFKSVAIFARQHYEGSEVFSASWGIICSFKSEYKTVFETTGVNEISKQKN